MFDTLLSNLNFLLWVAMTAGAVAVGWTTVRVLISTGIAIFNYRKLQGQYDKMVALQGAAGEPTPKVQTGSYL